MINQLEYWVIHNYEVKLINVSAIDDEFAYCQDLQCTFRSDDLYDDELYAYAVLVSKKIEDLNLMIKYLRASV